MVFSLHVLVCRLQMFIDNSALPTCQLFSGGTIWSEYAQTGIIKITYRLKKAFQCQTKKRLSSLPPTKKTGE